MDHPQSDGAPAHGATESQGPGEAQYQELWFSLARRTWSSMVLVPADKDGSADEVARRLAEIGKQLSSSPVTAITVKSLEYGTAMALADLPGFVERARQAPEEPGLPFEMPASTLDEPDPDAPSAGEQTVDAEPIPRERALQVAPRGENRLTMSSGARLIISIPPVVSQPLGLATAHNADLVVVCVEVGRTRLASARRTLDLIGRERVAGCFLIH
jgi:hypothetical protein